MDQSHNPDTQQLMADAVTQGLSPADQASLDELMRGNHALQKEMEQFELAAAAAQVALLSGELRSALPDAMRDQLIASATPYLTKPLAEDRAAEHEHHSFAEHRAAAAAAASQSPAAGFSWRGPQAIGWYVAMAALVGLAFVLFNPRETVVEKDRLVEVPVPAGSADPVSVPANQNTLAAQYETLANKPQVVKASFGYNAEGGAPRFAECGGEIVFDPETQTGYMKLTGMPVNDPDQEQYQLWIVDAQRPDETTNRVDGGVFDVDDSGECYVKVTPKIVAEQPAVFALTVERPGGVVVSKGPLQAVAAVQ